jgi:putative zinc finger/helix-turn-helix YgiT family protein
MGKNIVQRCLVCGKGSLQRQRVHETFFYETDADRVTVSARNVPIEVCDCCGEIYRGPVASVIRNRAAAHALGLLTGKEIQQIRKQWGLSLARFATLTGIDKELLSQWEKGKLLPARALDNYLRL